MKTKTYLAKCNRCKRKTEHGVYNISKRRGIRLACLVCREKKNRYTKINNLIEFHPADNGEKIGGIQSLRLGVKISKLNGEKIKC